MTPQIWAVLVVSAVVGLAIPIPLRSILERRGVVDVPVERSSHTRPTLRGGGIAPLAGVIVFGAASGWLFEGRSQAHLVILVSVAVAMSLVGLIEDTRGLSTYARLGAQALLGGCAAGALWWGDPSTWVWIVGGAVFFAANVNFTNFMDGVNGISGLHGMVVGGAFAILGSVEGETWLVAAGLITTLLFASFLPWNLTKPGIFLGDVGSYLLGALTAGLALGAIRSGLSPVAAFAPLAIYWADTVSTLIRRLLLREPIFTAHRTHSYQRLTDLGVSHVGVALIVAAFTAVSSLVGMLAQTRASYWFVSVAIAVVCIAYLLMPSLLRNRAKAVIA